MSSKTWKDGATLTLLILVVGVALAAYAFLPVSTFAADPGNGTISSSSADLSDEQADVEKVNPPLANETTSTTDQSLSDGTQETTSNGTQETTSNGTQETTSNEKSSMVNGTIPDAGNSSSSANSASSNDSAPSEDVKDDGSNGDNNKFFVNKDHNNFVNNSGRRDDSNSQQDNSGTSNTDGDKVDRSDNQRHEKKLYDDSKDPQGPKYYKYKHDRRGEQDDSNDGHKGEYYNSHQKKFFKYKHDFNYYDNVKIIIHHFYFKDFAGADFFVHFDYEHRHDGRVLIFFDHPFKDHEYDDEGRFYYDDDGNEYQCDEYYQGSVYYEYKNAFYKCEDLTLHHDFEGGY
jgi:hypothetical protein